MKNKSCERTKICKKGELQGTQYQLISQKSILVADAHPVVFNTKITNNSNVSYDPKSGEFTLCETGLYVLDWSISTSGAKGVNYVSFGLEVFGGMVTEQKIKTPLCLLSGRALVDVISKPTTIRLINTTGSEVSLNDTCVQANITIVHLSAV